MEITKRALGTCSPLAVGSGSLGLEKEYREKICQEIEQQYEEEPVELSEETTGVWTGDSAGFNLLHKDEFFQPFFTNLTHAVKEYCNDIGINPSRFNFYVARSWGSRTTKDQYINIHSHSYAHISAVYYPVAVKNAGNILLSVARAPLEIIPQLFCKEAYQSGLISYNNPYSLNSICYEPEDDMYLIFPAKTDHETDVSKSDDTRYSVAVDYILTLADEEGHEVAMPDPKTWTKL